MSNWSEEALLKAETAMNKEMGTWHQKIAAAIDAAIEQRRQEEYKVMNERLQQKIQELEGSGGA